MFELEETKRLYENEISNKKQRLREMQETMEDKRSELRIMEDSRHLKKEEQLKNQIHSLCLQKATKDCEDQEKSTEIESLKTSISAGEKKIKRLETDLDENRKQLEAIRQSVESLSDEHDSAAFKHREILGKQETHKSGDKNAASTELLVLQTNKAEAEREIESMKSEIASLRDNIVKNTKRLKEAEQQIAVSQKAASKKNENESKANKLRAELKKAKDEKLALTPTGDRRSLREQSFQLRAKLDSTREELKNISKILERRELRYSNPGNAINEEDILGVCSKLIRVREAKFEPALQVAAGGKAYHQVVRYTEVVQALEGKIRTDYRTTFMPLDRLDYGGYWSKKQIQHAKRIGGESNVWHPVELVDCEDEEIESIMRFVFSKFLFISILLYFYYCNDTSDISVIACFLISCRPPVLLLFIIKRLFHRTPLNRARHRNRNQAARFGKFSGKIHHSGWRGYLGFTFHGDVKHGFRIANFNWSIQD